ncbi:tRNA (cytosine(38)-C(5))-methyltransferase isoform X1 [Periplaneta americana]|uniref:tRNA (cytosine(38)-C(5))-methyltransferase isoform X1 n=2 Tax=Periplaneta americana TaxID=6978 RepID=UPI0037E8CEEF
MNVLELYSGIGGMHYAFKESGLAGEIKTAVDINTIANKVYQHNFPGVKLLQRNIQSLTAKEINSYNIDMILMSPPCQPFTRVGLKRDTSDSRTCSFLHLLKLFPDIDRRWKYLLVENVKGFEKSEACYQLIQVLEALDFRYQQFILSPSMFSIPNTRHRYYLIAKRNPLDFTFSQQPNVMESFPVTLHGACNDTGKVYEEMFSLNSKYKCLVQENEVQSEETCYALSNILEVEKFANYFEVFKLPEKVLEKHSWLLDIVWLKSRRSCCFTKAYAHYVEGTGSVFCPESPEKVASTFQQVRSYEPGSSEHLQLLKGLKLRYFTPREISRLMCFPDQYFSFPSDITTKQSYRLLGNSINVHVVALLILLMTAGDNVC